MPDAEFTIRKQIVGADLSAVTFVRDYVQLDFDGPKFNVLTPMTVACVSASVVSGEDQFRNRLCDQIGEPVTAVTVKTHESLVIEFSDQTSIVLSLKDEDYPGPEAVIFYGSDGVFVVI